MKLVQCRRQQCGLKVVICCFLLFSGLLFVKTCAFCLPKNVLSYRTRDQQFRGRPTSLLFAIDYIQNEEKSKTQKVADESDNFQTKFDRNFFESKYRNNGTFNKRWNEFIKESTPFIQQATSLWVRGKLSRNDPQLASIARQTLTNLGPVFVKLGQIVSVREDILGKVWSTELAKLQNSVTEFGGPEAVNISGLYFST